MVDAQQRRRTARHGGARNSRGRVSQQLTAKQCRNLLAAAGVAIEIGKPFNRWITIAWERGGVDPRDNAAATGRFVKMASEWMRARGERLIWAWVQEASERTGAHVHMLLHVPPLFDPLFRPYPLRWVKRVLPGPYIPKILKVEKLATGLGEGSDPAVYETLVLGKVHYMLKAAPHALERQLDMEGRGYKPWGQPCATFGKRMGIWQGWKAATVCE